ncbi:hypothetical protein V5F53_14305 [Xanthobacter sp. V4C-4]|uniref:general secretion pathway protein GspK n=1 Tax=Xanthobacter cornucopiae TaxID=3119924 RepID=UPI003728632F
MSAAPPRFSPRAAQGGFILVAVLWILAALAAFAGVYAYYLSNAVASAAARSEELAARSLATAALELTAYRLLAQPRDERPSHGTFDFRMGKARVFVGFAEESARIDLNAAPKELVAGLFAALGARPEAADAYARRIVAWRSSDVEPGAPDEDALYHEARLGYGPRRAPFVHVDELWRVSGLPPELVHAALPHLTVFSGRPQVNLADADPVVRAAVAAARPAGEGEAGDAPAPAAERSEAVRVRVRVVFGGGRGHVVEAVMLLRDFGDDPYRLLAWREGAPAGPGGGGDEGGAGMGREEGSR